MPGTGWSTTTLASYTHDALNRRVTEDRSGTVTDLYYSDQWQVLEERVSGTTKIQYVWSPVYVDALVLRDRDADGNAANGLEERLYAQQDGNYNVTALVDAAGNVVERYVQDPYGNIMVLTPSWGNRGSTLYGWVYYHQGGRYEALALLYDFGYRGFSAVLGRWLQRDPIEFAGRDVNLYAYVINNPVNSLDPSGLEPPEGGRRPLRDPYRERPYLGKHREPQLPVPRPPMPPVKRSPVGTPALPLGGHPNNPPSQPGNLGSSCAPALAGAGVFALPGAFAPAPPATGGVASGGALTGGLSTPALGAFGLLGAMVVLVLVFDEPEAGRRTPERSIATVCMSNVENSLH